VRFVDAIVGGAIPRQFLPAVEKGVRAGLAAGAVAGYPVEDIEVEVYDGKYHAVDSKEVAFVAAGRKALSDALNKAQPIVLEPVVALSVASPGSHVGDITGDLSSRRGRINETVAQDDGGSIINALVPLAELSDYASHLKSMTAGHGSYSLSFSHHEGVPARVQQSLHEAWRPAAAAD
jgi:elongation factor G